MKTFRLTIIALMLFAGTVYAQTPRPGAFTTLQTTDTSANSLLVGCALGSSTCTGGIKAGKMSLSDSLALDGATITDAGIVFANATPAVTTMALYVTGTTLYFNGNQVQTGSIANVAYTNVDNNFSAVQTFALGIAVGNGTPSNRGVMIPTGIPTSTTTNLYNSSGILTWDLGAAFATVNTGNGAYELYAMDQNVRTTDPVVFTTVNTGQGAYELYAMDQNVRTSDAVTFASVILGGSDNIRLNSNFVSGDGGDEGLSVASDGVVSFSGAFKERGRSTAVGEWASQAYSAGDFTASSGDWTVDSGDVVLNRFMVVGKTVTWQFTIENTDVSATPNSLRIAFPTGFGPTGAARWGACANTRDNGNFTEPGQWKVDVSVSGVYASLYQSDQDNSWNMTASDNTNIACTVIFEIA